MAKFSIGLMKKYHTPKCTFVFALRELNGYKQIQFIDFFYSISFNTREEKKRKMESIWCSMQVEAWTQLP